MPFAHTDPSSGAAAPTRPDLPQGWSYSDEVDDRDRFTAAGRRRGLLTIVAVAVVVVVAVPLLLVVNAQRHYSAGRAALQAERYDDAVGEFSAATLVLFSYRDSGPMADYARREMLAKADEEQQDRKRDKEVTAALAKASAELERGSTPTVLLALGSVRPRDLQAVVHQDAAARKTANALAAELATQGRKALGALQWARAGRFADALLLLDPSSVVAPGIAQKAAAGERLSTRLAEARQAARDGEWRKALRLALAVLAARKGFPGAASVVADARQALKPKPKPAATQAVTTSTTTTTTGGSTSGGTSSGGSSQPAPP